MRSPKTFAQIRIGLVLILLFQYITSAQEVRFFRVAGPVAVTITEFTKDGTVTWANTPTNTVFTVQTKTVLSSEWVDWVQVPVSNATTVHRICDPNPPAGMAFIPAGSFVMGDNFNDSSDSWGERPLHTVYVSAFYMDRYEVTKGLWDEVYQWAITNGYSFEYDAQGKANNHPAHSMTWHDAAKWSNARSEKEGRVPAYYISAAQTVVYRSGQVDVQNEGVKWNAGYRLATEAEWEKAARGGNSGQRFPWGNTITHTKANYYGYPASSGGYAYDTSSTRDYHSTWGMGNMPYTSPAGSFASNGYGLYDMAGNVGEWCWDWWSSNYYSTSPSSAPRGPISGSVRVIRGGSWSSFAIYCRAANRSRDWPDISYNRTGFRCVLPSGQ